MFRRSNFAHHNSVMLSIKTNMWQSSSMQPCLTANLCIAKHFLFMFWTANLLLLIWIFWRFWHQFGCSFWFQPYRNSNNSLTYLKLLQCALFSSYMHLYRFFFLRISSTYFKLIVLISCELHLFRANYTYFKSTAPISSQYQFIQANCTIAFDYSKFSVTSFKQNALISM